MSTTIQIDTATCIKCGKCIKVCPAGVLGEDDKTSFTKVINLSMCILCGHCVAACPVGAVRHDVFPADKVHEIDYSKMPDPEQVMLLCKARRSNRAFSKQPIPDDKLEMILEAAHRAPTASNMQQVEFTLVTDPKVLREISSMTIDTFNSIAKMLKAVKPIVKPFVPALYRLLPVFKQMKIDFDNGNDRILRNATAAIFIHTPSDSRFGCQDANLAYQNGSLMAESLGVSQVYTGFVCTAIKQRKGKKIAELLGVKGTIHAGMALGMPSFKMANYIDKQDIKLNKI